MVTQDILNLAKDIHIPNAKAPTIPWGLVGAAAIIALVGLALYKTTVGKLLIFGGLGAVIAMFALNVIHR